MRITARDTILRSLSPVFFRDESSAAVAASATAALDGADQRQRPFMQRTRAVLRALAARTPPWPALPRGAAVARVVKWIAAAGLCLYLALAAILYIMQRSLMYFPETIHTTPAQAGLPQADEETLTASDGVNSTAWHVPPRPGKPVILYFHGNGGALRSRVGRFRTLIADGIGLVALEYRGYGGSRDNPSETGLIADAEAVYAFAAARYRTQQLVLWGESLGSGVAIALAAEKPVGRVILEAPFTSAAAAGAAHYWYLPVRLLMKDQFRSDERIAKVTAPVLILHGVHDRFIPYAMGERLFELTRAPRHIVRFLDGDHDDLDRHGALHAVGRFLAGDLDQ